MTEDEELAERDHAQGRWRLFRDVVSFQFKLAADGLRDLLLSPVSIAAALVGVLTDSKDPGKYFYRLLQLGHESDRWINLFNTHDEPRSDMPSADDLVKSAESLIVKEYHKGGVVQNLKNRTDSVLDKIPTPSGDKDTRQDS